MSSPAFRHSVRALLVVALALGPPACAQTFDATSLGVEASMASPADNQPTGEAFRLNRKAVYLFWGIVPASHPSLDQVLAAQVTGDARVANLRIRVRSRWSDVLLTVLTGGLVVPRSVTFEGVILRQ